jgi:hypothetical protein
VEYGSVKEKDAERRRQIEGVENCPRHRPSRD